VQYEVRPADKDDGKSDRGPLPPGRIATAWPSLPGSRGGIGWRLLVGVLLFSSVITLLLTLVQLYLDYRRDVGAIDLRMSEIDGGYRQSLGEGIWRLNSAQLQLQIEGIRRLPDIRYVELREATDRAAPLVVTAGSRQDKPPVWREFKIFYTNHGAEQLVGILVVEATFAGVYRRLLDTAVAIMISQGVKTFIVSFFILLIVHRLITRHLTAIAASLRGYDLRVPQAPLRLDRRPPRQGDELDGLAEAFNRMYAGLQTAYCDIAEREKQQTAIAEMLGIISHLPIHSVLDAVAEYATRLADASNTEIFRLEGNLLRLVASYGEISVVIHAYQGVVVNRDTVTGRAACDRRTVHVHDLAAEESEYPVGSRNAKREGHRTTLGTPLLREGLPVGIILVRRREVRPFSKEQIALIETFAHQAVIAVENARLFEAEKQRTLALAQANRDLAEREAKIRRLVDSNVIGIFVWDFEGRFLEANDEFLRIVGYHRKDLIAGSMRWTDLTPPDWRERSNTRMEQQKSSGRFAPFEKEYTRKDGSRVPVLIGGALFEEDGNEGVAFVLDLTERRRAEQAVMRSEAYLAEAQKLTHTGSWAWDPRTEEVLYCSEEMFQIFGLDPRESSPSRENFRQQIHPEDRDRIKKKFEAALREKVDTRDDYRILLRDGTVRHISASGHLVLDQDGELIEFVGTATDVTERERAEGALRESELKLRQIIETMPSMLWSTAPDGEPTHVSQRVLDYAGLRFEDFLNFGWKEFLHPEDFPETARAFYEAIQTGEPYEAVHRLRRADGQYRWHHARGEPLRDKEQRIIQWYGLTVDIDERKRAEEQLRRSESYLAEAERLNHSGGWAVNRKGERTIVYWSEESYRIFGRDPLQGMPTRDWIWQQIHPDDRSGLREEADAALSEKRDYVAAFRILLPDGTIKYLESNARHVFSADGELLEVIGTFVDVTERKRADDTLRESELKLREIIETVPGLVWSNGPDGEPTHINQRMLDYSGLPFEEFMRRGWKAFVHPADFPETAETFYHAIETGTSYEGVMRLRRADGLYRWHHARAEPLRDREQRIIQWYGLSVDIDERKKAEDRLRRSEVYLAEAQRLSHSGTAAYNETEIFYWSDENYRIFGFDPREGLPSRKAALERIHPDDRERVREKARKAVEQRKDYALEFRIVLPSGNVTYTELKAHPKFSGSGELVEVVGTIIDVTERKHAEVALRESEAKFRDYAETASDWFWEIGPDYKFTLLTENAFGSGSADRIGTMCWGHALDLETEPEKWRLVFATLDARESFRDFVYCTVDGRGAPMYVKASGKPVFDSSEKFLGYRGTGTDVTAIVRGQRAEASLQTVQAELAHVGRVMTLGQLTASIAHEVNQPIGSARNNARAALNFLDRSPADLGEVREALACIVADADRAGGIIDRIRDQIKKMPPRSDRFDLNRAIEEVIGLAQSMMAENGVSVGSRLAGGMAPVYGDRVQLQQVVLNLIVNAVEAMSSVEVDERELLISTNQNEANGTLVAVRDSGPGIDPEHLELVFEAFYSTKSGMGMGLSICRSIIAAHEGRLWAAATEPKGALFQFTLPSAEAKASIARPFTTLESQKKTPL
jgi:PAS domain S-box-containing protein